MSLFAQTKEVVEREGRGLGPGLLFSGQDHKAQRSHWRHRHNAFLHFLGKNQGHLRGFLLALGPVQRPVDLRCTTDRHLKKCSYRFTHLLGTFETKIADLRRIFKLAAFGVVLSQPIQAKDFGVQGPVYEIKEPNLLERILTKLGDMKESGKLQSLQEDMAKKTKERARTPRPVKGLTRAEIYRSWIFDPTITVKEDLKDHKGTVFAHKGERVNPLDTVSFGKPLLLIDGTKEEQVEWALRLEGSIVLTKGSPLGLMEIFSVGDPKTEDSQNSLAQKGTHTRRSPLTRSFPSTRRVPRTRRVFFDQWGRICRQFEIKAVPARISQQDKHLLVEEFPEEDLRLGEEL